MAEDAPDKDERTEPASERKLDEARKKGSVAKSQDLNSAVMLLFGFFILMVFGGTTMEQISGVLRTILGKGAAMTVDRGSITEIFTGAMVDLAMILLPILGAFFLVGFTANVAQVGLKFSPEALIPKWNRLNPFTGIKKVMFSSHSASELVKGIFKTIVVGFIAYTVIDDMIVDAVTLVDADVKNIAQFIVTCTAEVIVKTGMAYAVIAAGDYFYQKFEFMRNMRMTKQEVKDEYKTSEGDPQIKGRIKTVQRQIAYKRMMSDVPKASVVVTNPTHFAVALKYETGTMTAPKVVAKGADLLAQRIKEIAKQHGVPIVEDKPLARALYRSVEIGEEIPEKLFQAVAQILAYIYRLKRGVRRSA